MSRPKPKFAPEPRILNGYQVACRLNKSEVWFGQKRRQLEQMGFPRQDEFLGGWDADAIERWIDERSGLFSSKSTLREEMEEWQRCG